MTAARLALATSLLLLLCACSQPDPGTAQGAAEEQSDAPLVSYTGSPSLRCDDIEEIVVETDEDAQGLESAEAAATAELAQDVRQGGELVDFGQSRAGPFGILEEGELSAVAHVTHLPSGGWAIKNVRRCQ